MQVERLLIQATTSLFFNMFELNEATSGHPLSTLAFFLIMQNGSIDGWDMDVIKLARYATAGWWYATAGRVYATAGGEGKARKRGRPVFLTCLEHACSPPGPPSHPPLPH